MRQAMNGYDSNSTDPAVKQIAESWDKLQNEVRRVRTKECMLLIGSVVYGSVI